MVFLHLWVKTRFGSHLRPLENRDVYIKIHNSGKVTGMKWQ